MDKSGGKISFGFSKTAKKPVLVKKNSEIAHLKPKVELIDSIEGSSVTFLGKKPDDKQDAKLVIPMTNDQKTRPIAKLMSSKKIKNEVEEIKKEVDDIKIENGGELTLEQRAAREIMEELLNKEIKVEAKVLELPIHPDDLPLEGAKEPTIDDYERIPINDFGKAMLRGMGWKEEEEKEKIFDVPVVRPKGLGLGADKVVKKQPLLIAPAQNETLEIKKRACVKVLAGKHKNFYGTVEGFDDGAGRVIVKLAIGALKIVMNEFMIQPVSKQEFAKYGKILNSEKYEEFKNADNKKEAARKSRSVSPLKARQSSPPSTSRSRDRKSKSLERERGRRSRDRRRHTSDSEDDKTNNRKYNERQRSRSHDKHRRKYSDSDSETGRHHSKKKSSKKHSKSSKKYSPDLYKSSDDERKHKRKYKRSKHHRDRS